MHIPRIIIAGTNSGVGKTTITLGIMAALQKRGLAVQAFKVGPDYIDPGHHTYVTKRTSRNLDSFMLENDVLTNLFTKNTKDADIAIIEGVMGLFDGGRNGVGSTANLAKLLKSPVILIIDVRSMADSAAAIAFGFSNYDNDLKIKGIILNRVGSQRHFQMVKEAIEGKINIPVIGYLNKNEELNMPERHLGLVPVEELSPNSNYDSLIKKIEANFDLTKILEIANDSEDIESSTDIIEGKKAKIVRLGVAKDAGFSFYYQDSLDELVRQGAELVYFSPLKDEKIPPDLNGLIFGGGYPEMFAKEFATNSKMKASIKEAHAKKMPIYAECGGLMYLSEGIIDFIGEKYEMVGLVPAFCQMQKKLVTVGYVEVSTLEDTVLGPQGTKLKGHEFHFSTMEDAGEGFSWAFNFKKHRDGKEYLGGFCKDNLLASYLHCHFAGNSEVVKYFLKKCLEFKINNSNS